MCETFTVAMPHVVGELPAVSFWFRCLTSLKLPGFTLFTSGQAQNLTFPAQDDPEGLCALAAYQCEAIDACELESLNHIYESGHKSNYYINQG